eukprot:5860203-Alexandrium_andersonii.AAC.1
MASGELHALVVPLRLRGAPGVVGFGKVQTGGNASQQEQCRDPFPFTCPGGCGARCWTDRKPVASGGAWPKW